MHLTKNNGGIGNPINRKLGVDIHTWSLPAGRHTCPGASALCAKMCYAKKGYFVYKNVSKLHKQNLKLSKRCDFARHISAQITLKKVKVLRIHVSGDFYDETYVRKWISIVKQHRRVQFFAYTRSWSQLDMLPALLELGQQPNMSLWWSADMATGMPPNVAGIPIAYMAIHDVDASHTPQEASLVFRVRRNKVMKKANDVFVCPAENGVTKMDCTSCRFCFDKKHSHRRQPQLVQLR